MNHRLALRTVLPAIASLMLALLVLPSTAAAQDGQRWPGRTITYFDATRDKLAVRRAVLAWNRTGARIRFVRTFNRTRANVVIRNTRDVPGGCGTGVASLGYPGRGRQGFVNILHGTAKDGQACALPGQTFVVTHELGHVLGLGHLDSRCALMNSSHVNGVAASGCLPGASRFTRRAQWRCRLIEPVDVRRVIRKYGGRMRAVRKNPWCNLVARIGAPAPISAAYDAISEVVTLTMRRPVDPPIPAYLRGEATEPQIEAYVDPTCRTTRPAPGNNDVFPSLTGTWSVAGGSDQAFTTARPTDAGAACWSVWALDAFGRVGTGVAHATLDLPPLSGVGGFSRGAAPRKQAKPATPPRTYDLSGDTAHPAAHAHLH